MSNFTDVMLDIESLSNEPQGVITTIAAVAFDRKTGESGPEFIIHIDVQDSLNKGLKVNGSTIMWWLQQSDEARNILVEGQTDAKKLDHALYEFNAYIQSLNPVCMWGNSARFDLGMLHDAHIAVNRKLPWIHRLERDVRTIASLKPDIKMKWLENFEGVKHNAIDDCKNQIGYVVEILNSIKE